MAKARSPAYPVIGLGEAIQKAEMIYKEDYQNPISRLVAANHMGYNGLNGKSLGVLSALQKFKLLEGRGDDTRVSDLAVQIFAHEVGAPQRRAAIDEAAAGPALFADLDARFQGGRASDSALRSYLLTMKFIPPAADATIRAYRETKKVVSDEHNGHTSGAVIEPEAGAATFKSEPPQVRVGEMHGVASGSGYAYGAASTAPQTGAGVTEIANIRVSKECAIRLVADGPYDKRSIEALVKNLQLQLELGTYDDDTSPATTTT